MNRKYTIVVLTFIVMFGWAGHTNAVLVDLTLSAHSDGTFELYASASSGDNGGIGFYGVELLGIDTITNLGPKVDFDDTDFEPHGFHYFRSADDDPVLVGSQNILDPGSIVYEFGQTGGTLPNGWGVVQQNYSAPLLLATGTFTDETQLGFGDDILLSVFTDVGVADTIEAPVNTSITLDGSAMFFESAEDRQLRLDAAYAAERERKLREDIANFVSVKPGAEPAEILSRPASQDWLMKESEGLLLSYTKEVFIDPAMDGGLLRSIPDLQSTTLDVFETLAGIDSPPQTSTIDAPIAGEDPEIFENFEPQVPSPSSVAVVMPVFAALGRGYRGRRGERV